jgi:hypothetical protein
LEPEARLSVDPAAIVPDLVAAARGVRVTVLPLDVTDVVGVRVVVVGVRVVVVAFVVVVRVAVLAAGFVAVPAGTSVRAGCADESPFASWMSLFSAESAAAELSVLVEHAPTSSANESASDAFNRGIYCTIESPPSCDERLGVPKLMSDCRTVLRISI